MQDRRFQPIVLDLLKHQQGHVGQFSIRLIEVEYTTEKHINRRLNHTVLFTRDGIQVTTSITVSDLVNQQVFSPLALTDHNATASVGDPLTTQSQSQSVTDWVVTHWLVTVSVTHSTDWLVTAPLGLWLNLSVTESVSTLSLEVSYLLNNWLLLLVTELTLTQWLTGWVRDPVAKSLVSQWNESHSQSQSIVSESLLTTQSVTDCVVSSEWVTNTGSSI